MSYYNLNPYWSNDTFMLYVSIIVSVFVFCLILKKKLRIGKRVIDTALLLPFIVLLFFKGFSATGTDLNTGYYINFNSSASLSSFRDQTIEIGYKFLNVIVYNIVPNYTVFIFIVALITLIPVFYVVKKYKDIINVPCALLIYAGVFYFSGFSAMRAALAYSILLLSLDSLYEKKNLKSFVLILVASSFHVTSLIALIPFFVVTFKSFSKSIWAILLVSLFSFIYVFRESIAALFVGRYSVYDMSSASLGLKYFWIYIPQIILFYFGSKRSNDALIKKSTLAYMITGFGMGILSYSVSIFGRMDYLFTPMIIYMPFYMKIVATTKRKKLFVYIATFVWCIVIFWLFINDNYLTQSLMPYQNIFGLRL